MTYVLPVSEAVSIHPGAQALLLLIFRESSSVRYHCRRDALDSPRSEGDALLSNLEIISLLVSISLAHSPVHSILSIMTLVLPCSVML